MKRILLFILSISICLSSAGQNIVSDFAKSLKGHCTTFDYSYSMSGSVPMSGSGSVKLQDSAFIMTGNGLDIKCDGKTRWTADTVAEECYIEDVSGEALDFEANPALLVGSVDKAFTLKKTSSATFNGRSVTEASLSPVSKNGDIVSVSLFLTSDKKPAGAVITTKDMNSITITIKNFVSGKALGIEQFRMDTKSLGKDYVITDLR